MKTEFSFCFPPRLESLIQIVWIYGPGLLLLNSTPMQALLPGILAMTPWPAGRIGQMRIFVALSWLMYSIELLCRVISQGAEALILAIYTPFTLTVTLILSFPAPRAPPATCRSPTFLGGIVRYKALYCNSPIFLPW